MSPDAEIIALNISTASGTVPPAQAAAALLAGLRLVDRYVTDIGRIAVALETLAASNERATRASRIVDALDTLAATPPPAPTK